MRLDGLDDLVTDGEDGVECRHGVLEDHGGDATAEAGEVVPAALLTSMPSSIKPGGGDFGGGGQEAEEGSATDGLARTAFAHDAEAFALIEREADAADGVDGAAILAEADLEVLDVDEWHDRTRGVELPGRSREACEGEATTW